MSDKILKKYIGNRNADDAAVMAAPEQPDGIDDLIAFGWLRGVKEKAVMLELRKKSGDILAIGYGWVERIEFNPSDGITLHMVGQKIKIKGRNLNAEARPLVRLFQGLAQHRIPWIQEADEPAAMQAGKGATVVEKIEW